MSCPADQPSRFKTMSKFLSILKDSLGNPLSTYVKVYFAETSTMIILFEFLNSRYKKKITTRWMSILTKTIISKLEKGDVDEEEVDIEVIEGEQP